MVTSEGNRIQPPTATPFDRPQSMYSSPVESPVEQSRAPQIEEQRPIFVPREPIWSLSLVSSGATIASMAGIGAAVLTIIGLSGVHAMEMMWIASIALGAAFVALGSIDATWLRMFRFGEHEHSRDRALVVSGMCTAFTVGIVAAVLGILNVAFIGNIWFSAVAALLLGFGLLLHSGVMGRVSAFGYDITYRGSEENRPNGPFAVNALSMAWLRDFIVGVGAIVLGILALLQFIPTTLILVAFLALGAAVTFTASTVCLATLATLENISCKR